MAYKGQPVPSTVHETYRAKISDGKSIRVKTTKKVEVGKFYLIDGFLGAAMSSASAGEEVVLNIEQAEYETDQIEAADDFNVGDEIYFDGAKFTTRPESGEQEPTPNRKAGRVTSSKDANNVIWFILGPQV